MWKRVVVPARPDARAPFRNHARMTHQSPYLEPSKAKISPAVKAHVTPNTRARRRDRVATKDLGVGGLDCARDDGVPPADLLRRLQT